MRLADADARSLPHGSESRQMYDALTRHFPAASSSSPVTVILRPGADPALAGRMRALPGIVGAKSSTYADGTSVLALTPSGPSDGPVANRLVRRIRAMRGAQPVLVAGDASHMTDYRAMLADRLPWALAAVLAAMLLLLFAFTGSVLIPIKTIATTLLSLSAALGIVVWIFQDGHLAGLFGTQGVGALNAPMPPVIVAIAFGLAMDYEIFILGRMREIWLSTGDARRAVVDGLSRTGRVVTCAALLLVPATMALLGSRAWWAPVPMRRLHARFGVREEAEQVPAAGPSAGARV
jgi:RND superfamily putative drug exporter